MNRLVFELAAQKRVAFLPGLFPGKSGVIAHQANQPRNGGVSRRQEPLLHSKRYQFHLFPEGVEFLRRLCRSDFLPVEGFADALHLTDQIFRMKECRLQNVDLPPHAGHSQGNRRNADFK